MPTRPNTAQHQSSASSTGLHQLAAIIMAARGSLWLGARMFPFCCPPLLDFLLNKWNCLKSCFCQYTPRYNRPKSRTKSSTMMSVLVHCIWLPRSSHQRLFNLYMFFKIYTKFIACLHRSQHNCIQNFKKNVWHIKTISYKHNRQI